MENKIIGKMRKNVNLFDFKNQPIWLNRLLTVISLILVLTFFLLAGFGLWHNLMILIAVFTIIIILAYAAHYLSNIIFSK